ncbi:triose-phosphate isomerase [Natronobeatus ordinarius]|uniref:triose-phosphate isomerase n=1 Tax=Natronobeatus ordinarius TaxID=2963433 RepID=UPI0020CCF943|nr:triose-phosphate isomerase [Natronobeatus ordinarius]
MSLAYPHFLLNFKVYEGTAGEDGLALAETIEAVGAETGTAFAVSPQTPDLRLLAAETDLGVVVQSADALASGRGNGKVSLEAVADAGADGVLINHPESPDSLTDVAHLVESCADFGLESIVCVHSHEMGNAALAFDPDCLLFENPADVATDRAMSRTEPGRLERFVDLVAAEHPRTRVMAGGGISVAEDVERAFDLGVDAAGAASAFLEADDRRAWLRDVAAAIPGSDRLE